MIFRRLAVAFFLSGICFSVEAQTLQKAIFAAGCFWCTEEAFEKVPGVVSAVSGYTGGTVKNPSYEQVSSGRTGHTGHAGVHAGHVHSRRHFAGGGRGLILGRSLILGVMAWMLGRLGGENLRAGEGQERCEKQERGGDNRFAHLHIR